MNERGRSIAWFDRAIGRHGKVEKVCSFVVGGAKVIKDVFPANPVVQTIFSAPEIAAPIVGVVSMIGHFQYFIHRGLLRRNQQPPQQS